jgi:SpoVK/Ycf46/Vps4 family AAA+-type ATPase
VVATANSAANLNAAFTRSGRFTATFYVEKPDREQKDEIWSIATAKYGLNELPPVVIRKGKQFLGVDSRGHGKWIDHEDQAIVYTDIESAKEALSTLKQKTAHLSPTLPDDSDWTGAEIDDCCEKAYLLDKSLVEAAKHVVPVFRRDKEGQSLLEEWARGATLSARTGELYGTEMRSIGSGSSFGGRVRRTVKRAAAQSRSTSNERNDDDDEDADEE